MLKLQCRLRRNVLCDATTLRRAQVGLPLRSDHPPAWVPAVPVVPVEDRGDIP